MTVRALRLGVVTVVFGSMVTLRADPAMAASESVSDDAGDVVSMHGATNHPAPRAAFADITALTSIHGPDKLTLKTTLAELVDRPALELYVGIDVQTDSGEGFMGQLMYNSEHGVTSLLLLGEHGVPKACFERILKGRVDETKSMLTFVIPTRCLGHPTWVRTDTSTLVMATNGHRSWRDDARAPYREPDYGEIYAHPVLGPEIYVG